MIDFVNTVAPGFFFTVISLCSLALVLLLLFWLIVEPPDAVERFYKWIASWRNP